MGDVTLGTYHTYHVIVLIDCLPSAKKLRGQGNSFTGVCILFTSWVRGVSGQVPPERYPPGRYASPDRYPPVISGFLQPVYDCT